MKKYIIPALIVAAMGLASCEDAIDFRPLDKETEEDYFTKASDLEMFTNPLYNNLLPDAEDMPKGNSVSDLMVTAALTEFTRCGGDRYVRASGNGWSWGNLRRCNDFLERCDRCPDKDAVALYSGVARFFRAYFYFEKLMRYGDVPWLDRPLGSADEQLFAPRDSREIIMQKIIEDLDFAIANLQNADDIKSVEKTFRATKGAALALKARACLYEGTFRKYHNPTINVDGAKNAAWYLEEAAKAAELLMSGKYGKYQLYTTGNPTKDYLNLFIADAANPDEYILARSYRASVSNNTHGLSLYSILSTHGRPGYTRKFINMYLMKDGSRFTDQKSWETMEFADETQNRDPRLAQSIITPGYCYPGETTLVAPNFGITPTGYLPIKWTQGPSENNNKAHTSQGLCTNDIPAFRYAEVLLNYAEAKAEAGTLTQDDLDKSINLIRSRAGMPSLSMAAANANPDPYLESAETGYPNVSGSNKGVILEIRRERAIELIQEGFRDNDLIRWHAGKCIDQSFSGVYFKGPGNYDLTGNGKIDLVLYTADSGRPTVPDADTGCQYLEIGRDIYLYTSLNPKKGDASENKGYVNYHAGNGVNRNGWNEERDYLYPIPYDELSMNSNLVQNPGW